MGGPARGARARLPPSRLSLGAATPTHGTPYSVARAHPSASWRRLSAALDGTSGLLSSGRPLVPRTGSWGPSRFQRTSSQTICFSCACIDSHLDDIGRDAPAKSGSQRSKGMRTGEPPSTGRVERTASAYSLTQVAEYLIT